jgi:hypothetical protein
VVQFKGSPALLGSLESKLVVCPDRTPDELKNMSRQLVRPGPMLNRVSFFIESPNIPVKPDRTDGP